MTASGEASSAEAKISITCRAYAQFRQDILVGHLEPGRKLKVEELRQRYGFGAGPIREALTLLVADTLVDRIDQRGFRVAEVSRDEFGELLLTRCWVEERALRESISRGDTEWEEALLLSFHRMSRTPRSPTRRPPHVHPEWEMHHKAFHMGLIGACGSGIMLRFCEQLYDRNIRYRQMSDNCANITAEEITAEHRELMEVAIDRDADKAVELLVAHYERTSRHLVDGL